MVNGEEKGLTRAFTAAELREMGLPKACRDGEVLEDRHVSSFDVTRRGQEQTDEARFVVFQLGGDIWGVPYVKQQSGAVSFDKITTATRYEWRRLLVQADVGEITEEAA
jgi:hypothetical protein